MVMCWALGCNHYSVRETCKYFRFPRDKKARKSWIKLVRRTTEPGPSAVLCSCHFKDGKRENGPTLFAHNKEKLFQFPNPEEKRRKTKTQTVEKIEIADSLVNHQPYTTTVQLTDNTVQLVCRTCLMMCGTRFDIFNYKRNNDLLADMLANCTSLEIQKEHRFPTGICNDCMQKLISAFDFKTMVIESSRKLQQFCQSQGIKKEFELYNDDVEDIGINEKVDIKTEETVITSIYCKNEYTVENQADEEKMDIDVHLESESSDVNGGFLNYFVETDLCLPDPGRTGKFEKEKQPPLASNLLSKSRNQMEKEKIDNNILENRTVKEEIDNACGNQMGKEEIDNNTPLESESLDKDGGFSEAARARGILPEQKYEETCISYQT